MDSFFQEGEGKTIVFSFSYCSPTKEYSLTKANKVEIEIKLFDVLREFERMSMIQIHALPREKGWTPERLGESNYDYLSRKHPGFLNYYHFRIKDKYKARVFVGSKSKDSNMIYVLFIDGAGRMNHS